MPSSGAERYYDAMGPKPQPAAKWIGEDRFAYSPGNAPWTIIEAATQRVVSSDAPNETVGGPGPGLRPPPGLAYFGAGNTGPASPAPWKLEATNGNLVGARQCRGDATHTAWRTELRVEYPTARVESRSPLLHCSSRRFAQCAYMHGTSDVNSSLSSTMRMIQALIDANKKFDLLIMPGQPHQPQGAAGRYYREDLRRFMAINLLPPA